MRPVVSAWVSRRAQKFRCWCQTATPSGMRAFSCSGVEEAGAVNIARMSTILPRSFFLWRSAAGFVASIIPPARSVSAPCNARWGRVASRRRFCSSYKLLRYSCSEKDDVATRARGCATIPSLGARRRIPSTSAVTGRPTGGSDGALGSSSRPELRWKTANIAQTIAQLTGRSFSCACHEI